MIRFLEDAIIEVIDHYDEELDKSVMGDDLNVKAGEIVDADVFDENEETANIQYGDGSVSYGVPKRLFEVIDEQ